jgi:hypothetical protein
MVAFGVPPGKAGQNVRRTACYCFEFHTGSAMMADARWERVCCGILLGCPLLRPLLLRGW